MIDPKTITMEEFYEKYCLIEKPDGTKVAPVVRDQDRQWFKIFEQNETKRLSKITNTGSCNR